jgi:hypothetical protein
MSSSIETQKHSLVSKKVSNKRGSNGLKLVGMNPISLKLPIDTAQRIPISFSAYVFLEISGTTARKKNAEI